MDKNLVSLGYKDFMKHSEYLLVSCSVKFETLQMTSGSKPISIRYHAHKVVVSLSQYYESTSVNQVPQKKKCMYRTT